MLFGRNVLMALSILERHFYWRHFSGHPFHVNWATLYSSASSIHRRSAPELISTRQLRLVRDVQICPAKLSRVSVPQRARNWDL